MSPYSPEGPRAAWLLLADAAASARRRALTCSRTFGALQRARSCTLQSAEAVHVNSVDRRTSPPAVGGGAGRTGSDRIPQAARPPVTNSDAGGRVA